MTYESERDNKLTDILAKYDWAYDDIDAEWDYDALKENVGEEDASLIISARSAYREIVAGLDCSSGESAS